MTEKLLISVIIPTCHRNDLLVRCLECLKSTVTGPLSERCEVIVTDDGVDSSAQSFLATNYPWATWVEGPHKGPAANRNCGARQANGQWLVFVDDDCLPAKSWLSVIAQVIETGNYDVIEGKTVSDEPEQDDPFKHYVENLAGGLYWSCNLAIAKSTFVDLAGFDEDFLEAGGEDLELAYRIDRQKLRTIFVADAVVVHPARKVTGKSLIWRTWLIRWQLLYRLKTGQGAPLSANLFWAAASLYVDLWVDLMRTTWHVVTKPHPIRRRKQIFDQLWKLITFGAVLPYMLVWEIKFRKLLKEKAGKDRR